MAVHPSRALRHPQRASSTNKFSRVRDEDAGSCALGARSNSLSDGRMCLPFDASRLPLPNLPKRMAPQLLCKGKHSPMLCWHVCVVQVSCAIVHHNDNDNDNGTGHARHTKQDTRCAQHLTTVHTKTLLPKSRRHCFLAPVVIIASGRAAFRESPSWPSAGSVVPAPAGGLRPRPTTPGRPQHAQMHCSGPAPQARAEENPKARATENQLGTHGRLLHGFPRRSKTSTETNSIQLVLHWQPLTGILIPENSRTLQQTHSGRCGCPLRLHRRAPSPPRW
jgi:hypothetical protein